MYKGTNGIQVDSNYGDVQVVTYTSGGQTLCNTVQEARSGVGDQTTVGSSTIHETYTEDDSGYKMRPGAGGRQIDRGTRTGGSAHNGAARGERLDHSYVTGKEVCGAGKGLLEKVPTEDQRLVQPDAPMYTGWRT